MKKEEIYSIYIDDNNNKTENLIELKYEKLYSKKFVFKIRLITNHFKLPLFKLHINGENCEIQSVEDKILIQTCQNYKNMLSYILLLCLDIYLNDIFIKNKSPKQKIIINNLNSDFFKDIFINQLSNIFKEENSEFSFETNYPKQKLIGDDGYYLYKYDNNHEDVLLKLKVKNYKEAMFFREKEIFCFNEYCKHLYGKNFKIDMHELLDLNKIFESIYLEYGFAYFEKHTIGICDYCFEINSMESYEKIYINNEKQYSVYKSDETTFVICIKQKIIGSIGFNVNMMSKCGLSYGLDIPYRYKGIMKDALKSVINYLHKTQNINFFTLIISPDNIASQKIAEYNGFISKDKIKYATKVQLGCYNYELIL